VGAGAVFFVPTLFPDGRFSRYLALHLANYRVRFDRRVEIVGVVCEGRGRTATDERRERAREFAPTMEGASPKCRSVTVNRASPSRR
jgi:hypothetical protein